MADLSPTTVAYFWSKVDAETTPIPECGCIVWLGWVYKGYGRIMLQGKIYSTHRLVYELVSGPIPDGLVIDHKCRVPSCINPAHLEAVSMRENTLRGYGSSAVRARQTHCKNGHAFTADNIVPHLLRRRGKRQCRICYREVTRKAKHRRRLRRRAREELVGLAAPTH